MVFIKNYLPAIHEGVQSKKLFVSSINKSKGNVEEFLLLKFILKKMRLIAFNFNSRHLLLLWHFLIPTEHL